MSEESDLPANQIRAWRKFRGLTQEQLAEMIGYDRTVVSKIERGSVQYTQGFLEKAAEILQCTPGELISRDPTASAQVLDIWHHILERDRSRALDVLKAFKAADEK
jgi:transcriptional regulator with XRE-family HTH domain